MINGFCEFGKIGKTSGDDSYFNGFPIQNKGGLPLAQKIWPWGLGAIGEKPKTAQKYVNRRRWLDRIILFAIKIRAD